MFLVAAHLAFYGFHDLKRGAVVSTATNIVGPDVEAIRRMGFLSCAVVRPSAIHDQARLIFRSATRCVCNMFILFPDCG